MNLPINNDQRELRPGHIHLCFRGPTLLYLVKDVEAVGHALCRHRPAVIQLTYGSTRQINLVISSYSTSLNINNVKTVNLYKYTCNVYFCQRFNIKLYVFFFFRDDIHSFMLLLRLLSHHKKYNMQKLYPPLITIRNFLDRKNDWCKLK